LAEISRTKRDHADLETAPAALSPWAKEDPTTPQNNQKLSAPA